VALLKLRKIGSSLGVILPKEVLNPLHVKEGDTLYLTQDSDGLTLSPFDPDFEAIMETADECDNRYKNTLKRLAK